MRAFTAIPVIMQARQGESAAVCLAMLLAHFGSFPKLVDVKLACGFQNDELDADNMLAVARRFGLDAQALALRPGQLAGERLPLLIRSRQGRYLLLVKAASGAYTLHDPEHGRVTRAAAEFEADWSGLALRLLPGSDFRPVQRLTSLHGELLRWLDGDRAGLWYVMIAGLVLLIPAIVVPTLSKLFFDDIIIRGQDDWLYPMLSFMAAALVLGSIIIYLQQRVLLQTELKMSITRSAAFVSHLLKVPYAFLWANPAGDTIKRIALNDAVAGMLTRNFTTCAMAALSIVFYALVMTKYSPILTVVGVSVILVNFIALRYFSVRRTALNQSLYMKQQRTFNASSELIRNIEAVKTQGWENAGFGAWAGHLIAAINESQRLGYSSRVLTVLPDFLTKLNSVLIVLLGGILIMNGEISVGVFVALQSFIANFSEPVKDCVDGAKSFQENAGNMSNLIEVRELPVDPLCSQDGRQGIDEIDPSNARLDGAIEIRGLGFSYNKFAPPLIEDFSLSIAPGARIAFVGRSGSGKSTLLKVLAGLLPADTGEILYGGRPLRSVNSDVLRTSIAMIDQNLFLFSGTVADNITMWNRSIDQEDIVRAARDAVIHDMICEKPGGYQARVDQGGGNFSGGQCQRIEIARGLLMRPAVVFLDEATSALDSHTEQQVMENLRRYGCTMLTVAHRLSTIRDHDEILVLDAGKVVQRGTHDELMRQEGGLYQQLAASA
jgi:NHLM bacteriocin system ABC transporter peptidase/ATP-binding protein